MAAAVVIVANLRRICWLVTTVEPKAASKPVDQTTGISQYTGRENQDEIHAKAISVKEKRRMVQERIYVRAKKFLGNCASLSLNRLISVSGPAAASASRMR